MNDDIVLDCYYDASWANINEYRTTMGYIFIIGKPRYLDELSLIETT
jgi:hypothetical protein